MADSDSPSHLYVRLLKAGLRNGWSLGAIDLKVITSTLLEAGYDVDPKTGRFSTPEKGARVSADRGGQEQLTLDSHQSSL